VENIDDQVADAEKRLLADIGRLLDQQSDATAAASQVRALMFINKFRADIARRLDALDQ